MQPYDEIKIGDDDKIIRRIDPKNHVVLDANCGGSRISSKAFQASTKLQSGMSVDIENLILKDGKNPQQFITTPRFSGSVFFSAKIARNLGLRVGYEPIPENGHIPANPYHGEIWGTHDKPYQFTTAQKKGLHRAVEWYVELPNVAIR